MPCSMFPKLFLPIPLLSFMVASAQAQIASKAASDEVEGLAGEIAEISKRDGVEIIVIRPTGTGDEAAADAETVSVFERIRSALDDTSERADSFFGGFSQVPGEFRMAVSAMQGAEGGAALISIVLQALAALAIGWFLVQLTYKRYVVAPWLESKIAASPETLSDKVPVVVTRLLSSLLGLTLTVVIAYAVLRVISTGGRLAETTNLHIIALFIGVSIVAYLWRMIFAPYLPAYRIPKFHPDNLVMCTIAARKIYRWLLVGALISGAGIAVTSWLNEIGANAHAIASVALVAGLVAVVYNVALSSPTGRLYRGRYSKGARRKKQKP